MIKGINVVLKEEIEVGKDPFNRPIYSTNETTVNNVLVAPASNDEIVTSTELFGKRAEMTLGIPKGDEHDWENKEVVFFGYTWKTFGPVIQGIEANVPTKWHKKVMCFRYE